MKVSISIFMICGVSLLANANVAFSKDRIGSRESSGSSNMSEDSSTPGKSGSSAKEDLVPKAEPDYAIQKTPEVERENPEVKNPPALELLEAGN